METYTLINCGKEVVVGKPPVITSKKGQIFCDIDYVGFPGVNLELGNSGWNRIWCHTTGCRFYQMGNVKPGIPVQKE